ncbi:MAG: hypothetical protein ACFFD4_26600 [Candidatus Odinarchaeota archaeon]
MQEQLRTKRILPLSRRLPGEDDYYQTKPRRLLSFTGSLVESAPKQQMKRIASLHNKITAQETGYQNKRRFIELGGILSQWFETGLLDQVFLLLGKITDRKESSEEEEIKKILAYLDVILRFQGNTIRWKTLTEISSYFSFELTRKSLFKYRYEVQKALSDQYGKKVFFEKILESPTLLMKRLVVEFISHDSELNREQKREVHASCYQLITAMKDLKFIPRDYEIYSYAAYSLIKKELTGVSGRYTFPVDNPKFRRAISNAIYKIKTQVIMKIWSASMIRASDVYTKC